MPVGWHSTGEDRRALWGHGLKENTKTNAKLSVSAVSLITAPAGDPAAALFLLASDKGCVVVS